MWVDSLRGYWVGVLVLTAMPGLAAADMAAGFAAIERKDYELALQELRPLAEAGDPTAQYNLGVLYQFGYGTNKDEKAAASWFLKSAEQGNAEAAFAVGMSYGTGDKELFDPIEAYAWFRVASRQGHKDARKNLHKLARRMSVSQIKQARELYDQRAAEMAN